MAVAACAECCLILRTPSEWGDAIRFGQLFDVKGYCLVNTGEGVSCLAQCLDDVW